MRLRELIGRRTKEKPSEATLTSHVLTLRGGYARQVANGIYSILPIGTRVIRKIERVIRDEMDRIGGQEVILPVALPRELWDESGRYTSVGKELVRFKDRAGHDMVLGMTHEEAVVHLCRSEAASYRNYPFMVYQIQTKFRDEPRSRGGLIRVREFTMKDAYSFHTNQAELEEYYRECMTAYYRIFSRVGLPEVVAVASDSGMMGGNVAHEFMLLCDAGEDTIIECPKCQSYANAEVAVGVVEPHLDDEMLPLQKVATPEMREVQEVSHLLGLPAWKILKTVAYAPDEDGRLVLVLIRGDIPINDAKLAKLLRRNPEFANEEAIRHVGAVPGFIGPLAVDCDRVVLIVDRSVATVSNLVCGANEGGHHMLNFNLLRDLPKCQTVDVGTVCAGHCCPACNGPLLSRKGIELGNIFQLGTKYTLPMGMRYLSADSTEQIPIMGCYGIGVGRLMASVMEVRSDRNGPIWPVAIAPWTVHVIAVQADDISVLNTAKAVYHEISSQGYDVLFDDRDERPGIKFADADLIGVPFRINVSNRNIGEGKVEVLVRGNKTGELVMLNQIGDWVKTEVERALLASTSSCRSK